MVFQLSVYPTEGFGVGLLGGPGQGPDWSSCAGKLGLPFSSVSSLLSGMPRVLDVLLRARYSRLWGLVGSGVGVSGISLGGTSVVQLRVGLGMDWDAKGLGLERETKRDRERQRETERDREREGEGERQRETERDRERQRETE